MPEGASGSTSVKGKRALRHPRDMQVDPSLIKSSTQLGIVALAVNFCRLMHYDP